MGGTTRYSAPTQSDLKVKGRSRDPFALAPLPVAQRIRSVRYSRSPDRVSTLFRHVGGASDAVRDPRPGGHDHRIA